MKTAFLIASSFFVGSAAFLVSPVKRTSLALLSSSSDEPTKIPQLPAWSSFQGEEKAASFASDKFEIQYTCKVCETRNSNKVSRVAYRNGVVICICKGCMSQHVIADNLGWTNFGLDQGERNIEEYFASRGLENHVNRVSEEVFELEKVWNDAPKWLE